MESLRGAPRLLRRTIPAAVALACTSTAFGFAPQSAGTDKPGLLERDHPLAAWQAITTHLGEKGLQLELFYTLDLLANVDGGIEREFAAIGNLDLLAAADLEALMSWRDTWLVLYAIGNHGEISPAVGDFQAVSNIEAPATVKLFEAWIEKELAGRHLSVLAGLYDVNSEFDVIPSAAVFLNGSQGMGAELGNSGRNGPSTFPTTSLGLRLDYQPAGSFYARAVVADGVPGSLDDDKRTQIELDGDDGLFLLAEAGYINITSERLRGRTRRYADEVPLEDRRYGFFGKFALGVWHYTGEAQDLRNPATLRRSSPGLYALAEQRVFYEPDDPMQGLSLFARAGAADGRTQPIDGYLGAGAVYRGCLPSRHEDELGLAVAAAHFGSSYRSALSSGGEWDEWEIDVELTYRWRISPWLSLQPNVQRVFHPGGDPSVEDATVVGLRMLASF